MRNGFIVALATVLILSLPLAAGAAPSSPPAQAPPSGVAGTAGERPLVEVDDLLKAPEKHQGALRVRGMVRKVFAKEQRLGLLDARYANCCSTPCETEKLLPVAWAGEMPRVRALVLISGDIQRRDGKMEFVATGIEPAAPAGGTSK
ncbi:MAG TPA: hypothetical protein VI078_15385 [bacterium]